MEITVLHLSDLHMEKKNVRDIEIVLAALWKDIAERQMKIDFILFNGDLIKHGGAGLGEEYPLAMEKFISPLLGLTGLPYDRFIMVPGNHEVNRNKINKFVDAGLSDKFHDRDELNNFIDTIDKNEQLLSRLEDYNVFVDNFYKTNNIHIKNRNKLYTTYIIPHNEMSIGIACLNTAWCAVGGDDDYGKILLGERQVDNAIEDLAQCDLKLALFHHPLEWLKEFDRESVTERIITGFDIVFTGHLHSQNYKQVAYSNFNTVFLRAASLYQGRTYNGYSLVKINLVEREVELFFREYFDGGRRVFGKAERVAPDGYLKMDIHNHKGTQLLKKNLKIKKDLKRKVYEDINKSLITVFSDSAAPKVIDDIFVEPVLSKQQQNTSQSEEKISDEDIDLNQLLSSNNNILLIGKKEIGKTTLLNYVCNHYLNNFESAIIPIIINFNDLPNGKNVVQKAISNYLINYDVHDFDVTENVECGNFLLLIDNLNVNNHRNLERLRDFCLLYPNNRIILTMNEDILQTIKIKDLPDLGFKYDFYYIYTFMRGQIRKLVNNWFSFKSADSDLILDRVLLSLKSIGMPRTPLVISLMLWVIEKQANFIPVNEASLIENFIETLLEKLNPEDAKYENMGYSIKKDFLTNLSTTMVKKKVYYMENNEFEEEYINYFRKKGLEIRHEVKNSFFEKGILLRTHENKVYFRFKCFLEYFIALGMNDYKELFEFILSDDNYLNFSNEIIYFTGLNQKETSYQILKIIEERLLDSFQRIDEIVNLDEISNLPIKELLYEVLKDENITEKLEDIKLTDDEKDALLEDKEVDRDKDTHQVQKNINKDQVNEIFIKNLEIYANVLKNCELIDLNLKINALSICINKYSKLVGIFYKILYSLFVDKLENKEIQDEDFVYMLTMGVPLALQGLLLQNLGSPKLKVPIEEQLKVAKTDFEKLMLVCLYGDMRLEGYIGKLNALLKSTESKLIKEVIFNKLFYYQAFYSKSKYEEAQLINAISEYMAEKNASRTKRDLRKQAASKYKELLLKRSLIEKQKNRVIE